MKDSAWTPYVYGACTIVILILVYQSFHSPAVPQPPPKEPEKPCIGEPITVSYAYPPPFSADENPWECKTRCESGQRYYILYSNGLGSQCGEAPTCLDWGEDNNETCIPSMASGNL